MLLAGMATRTLCATASPGVEKLIEKTVASATPYRRSDPSVIGVDCVFMSHSLQSFFCHSAGNGRSVWKGRVSVKLKFLRIRDRCHSQDDSCDNQEVSWLRPIAREIKAARS